VTPSDNQRPWKSVQGARLDLLRYQKHKGKTMVNDPVENKIKAANKKSARTTDILLLSAIGLGILLGAISIVMHFVN